MEDEFPLKMVDFQGPTVNLLEGKYYLTILGELMAMERLHQVTVVKLAINWWPRLVSFCIDDDDDDDDDDEEEEEDDDDDGDDGDDGDDDDYDAGGGGGGGGCGGGDDDAGGGGGGGDDADDVRGPHQPTRHEQHEHLGEVVEHEMQGKGQPAGGMPGCFELNLCHKSEKYMLFFWETPI